MAGAVAPVSRRRGELTFGPPRPLPDDPDMPTRNGRTAFLELLVDEGITHLFGNPGTTELPIMEVVPDFPQLKFVLGLQESVVLGMADGFARASGRLAAANVHVAPGL